jgi:lipid-A-disaccharide synthase
VGFLEAASFFKKVLILWKMVSENIRRHKPDLIICVDSPSFNTRCARFAREYGIPVLWFFAPQIWAWRPGRIKVFSRLVDVLCVVFDFEVDLFKRCGIDVRLVGHPVLDEIQMIGGSCRFFPGKGSSGSGKRDCTVALLPGSRRHELLRHLPVMLDAMKIVSDIYGEVKVSVVLAPFIDRGFAHDEIEKRLPFANVIELLGRDLEMDVKKFYSTLQLSDVAVTKSGTSTLQLAVSLIPMVVMYRLNPISYAVARLLSRQRFISLPNILMAEGIVPELIQKNCNAGSISRWVLRLLESERMRQDMMEKLKGIGQVLGDSGVARRVAKIAMEMTG